MANLFILYAEVRRKMKMHISRFPPKGKPHKKNSNWHGRVEVPVNNMFIVLSLCFNKIYPDLLCFPRIEASSIEMCTLAKFF